MKAEKLKEIQKLQEQMKKQVVSNTKLGIDSIVIANCNQREHLVIYKRALEQENQMLGMIINEDKFKTEERRRKAISTRHCIRILLLQVDSKIAEINNYSKSALKEKLIEKFREFVGEEAFMKIKAEVEEDLKFNR